MTKNQDILLNEDYSIKVVNGDLAIGDADAQNVDLLLQLDKGHLREYPLNGVGITKYINSPTSFPTLRNTVSRELSEDGYSLDLFYYDESIQDLVIDFK